MSYLFYDKIQGQSILERIKVRVASRSSKFYNLCTAGNRERELEILVGYLFIVKEFASYKQSTHMCLKIFTKTCHIVLAGFLFRSFSVSCYLLLEIKLSIKSLSANVKACSEYTSGSRERIHYTITNSPLPGFNLYKCLKLSSDCWRPGVY